METSLSPAPLPRRFRLLGTASVALATFQCLYCFQVVITAALLGPIFDLHRKVVSSRLISAASARGAVATTAARARELVASIAAWEIGRALLLAAAATSLVVIARRLRKGEQGALSSARVWAVGALVMIGLSAMIQLIMTIPKTTSYQQRLMAILESANAGSGAFRFARIVDFGISASATLSLLVAVVLFAAGPLVIGLWADRLLREPVGYQASSGSTCD